MLKKDEGFNLFYRFNDGFVHNSFVFHALGAISKLNLSQEVLEILYGGMYIKQPHQD